MRVLHCCLANFYIDNYGYQENILPKMHKLQGHEVAILASTETYIKNKKLGYVPPSEYTNNDGIPVTRLPYLGMIPNAIVRKLRIYVGIKKVLDEFGPDIIFIHDCQFIGIKEVASYAKDNSGLEIYVDSHTDFINSGKNWVSKNILHKIIYKWCAKKIEPYTKKFYGTLPLRVDFYKEIYGIPAEKLELLVLGADQTIIDFTKRTKLRLKIRNTLGIGEDDLVLVAGGKIDERKKIHTLLQAINSLSEQNIHLILFGLPNTEMKDQIEQLSNENKNIHNIGWLKQNEIYHYLFAGDIAIFPGTHSVLWEQCIGIGIPCVFKRWKGIEHVDVGGNCLFLERGDKEEIKKCILEIMNNRELLNRMKKVSIAKGMKVFSYYEIAKRAIDS